MHAWGGWLFDLGNVAEEEFQPTLQPKSQPGGGDGFLKLRHPVGIVRSVDVVGRPRFEDGDHREFADAGRLLWPRRGVPPVWVINSSISPLASSLFKARTDLPNRSWANCSTAFLSSLCSSTIFRMRSRCLG